MKEWVPSQLPLLLGYEQKSMPEALKILNPFFPMRPAAALPERLSMLAILAKAMTWKTDKRN